MSIASFEFTLSRFIIIIQIKEIEEYLDTKGIVVEANETEEQLPRLFRAIEKCSQIFCDPSVQSQGTSTTALCRLSYIRISWQLMML